MQYAAFGATQSSTGTSPSRLKYTGREDDGTGLYYYRARYYDSTIGRFVSEDPLGFAAGDVNFYSYVGNNPVNANDSTGLMDVEYRAGSSLGSFKYWNDPGFNFTVLNDKGASYPMGEGVFQRTVVRGRPFNQVFDSDQTLALVNWGRSFIQNTRLDGATGDASLLEIATQSGSGQPWDTKQFLPSTNVYTINGKAELNDYVGNVIWGAGVKSLGANELVSRTGAQVQSLLANRSFDDARDQEAISFGYSLPSRSSLGPGASNSWGGGAAGGFLLYPNKPNTNQMQSVYSK